MDTAQIAQLLADHTGCVPTATGHPHTVCPPMSCGETSPWSSAEYAADPGGIDYAHQADLIQHLLAREGDADRHRRAVRADILATIESHIDARRGADYPDGTGPGAPWIPVRTAGIAAELTQGDVLTAMSDGNVTWRHRILHATAALVSAPDPDQIAERAVILARLAAHWAYIAHTRQNGTDHDHPSGS